VDRLRVYADATSLIGLARLDRLDILSLLPQPIYVTERVWREVASDAQKAGAATLLQAREAGLLAVVDEGDPDAFPQLDAGENTVLSASAAAGAAVLVDERKARGLIESDPYLRAQIRGATGVVAAHAPRQATRVCSRRAAPLGRADQPELLAQPDLPLMPVRPPRQLLPPRPTHRFGTPRSPGRLVGSHSIMARCTKLGDRLSL